MRTVFTASHLYTPTEEILNPLLVVEDGRIVEVTARTGKEAPSNAALVDFGDAVLAPGFLDIHMHGGAGVDLMRAAPADLPGLGRFLTSHGVTGYFPTTVAAPLDATCAALERLAEAIEASEEAPSANGDAVQARPLAIHLEGPFLSHKRRGVHPPEYLVAPTIEIFDRLWEAAGGHVRMITIAPEIPGALEVIAEAAQSAGITPQVRGQAAARSAREAYSLVRPNINVACVFHAAADQRFCHLLDQSLVLRLLAELIPRIPTHRGSEG